MEARSFLLCCIAGSLMRLTSFAQTTPYDSVYTIVDEMPKFGKADFDLMSYLIKHVQFGSFGNR